MPAPLATIQELRRAQGWNHHELALRLGVNSATVQSWERGMHRPHPRSLHQMATLFGVPAEDIMLTDDDLA